MDGPAAAEPEALCADLVDPIRERGGPALAVPAGGVLYPASTRLELGRTNPDAFYERWVDYDALRREVLDPRRAGRTGRVLPSRWDPVTDRATRQPYQLLPERGVVLVGGGLTLPAYARYRDEVAPESVANLVVRLNDPRRPALVDGS